MLVDLATDPNALSMPPHITLAQVKGFTIAPGKTVVMSGGLGKLLEMARANLRSAPLPR